MGDDKKKITIPWDLLIQIAMELIQKYLMKSGNLAGQAAHAQLAEALRADGSKATSAFAGESIDEQPKAGEEAKPGGYDVGVVTDADEPRHYDGGAV